MDVPSLRNYLAARHGFAAAQLSADDARELVMLTVGNAYLLVLADKTRVSSVQAQVATSKVSLNQAEANHQAGTAPLLDELRARVDYQTLEQQLIVAQNGLEKDKLGLARVIGLPLAQQFHVVDTAPYAAFDQIDVNAAIREAHANRKDLAAMLEQTKVSEDQRKAVTDERLPKVVFSGDYGDIGVNVRHSHGTGNAQGTVSAPLFREFGLRGEAQVAQSQLDTQQAQLSDKKAQVDADVRDALLDIASAQQQVEVSRSSVELANEALSEAQQRYANGVSDNLAVSQARAVRGPGQRSVHSQPLPAQRRQAQPGARAWCRPELQELFGRKVAWRKLRQQSGAKQRRALRPCNRNRGAGASSSLWFCCS